MSTGMGKRSFARQECPVQIMASTCTFCDVGRAGMSTAPTVRTLGCVAVRTMIEVRQGWRIEPHGEPGTELYPDKMLGRSSIPTGRPEWLIVAQRAPHLRRWPDHPIP